MIDLNALYDEYNDKLFNGELPEIDVVYMRMSNAYGFTICYQEGINELVGILIDKDLTKKEIRGTLVHEMIHAYLFTKNKLDYHDHDSKGFIKQTKRAAKLLGWKYEDIA